MSRQLSVYDRGARDACHSGERGHGKITVKIVMEKWCTWRKSRKKPRGVSSGGLRGEFSDVIGGNHPAEFMWRLSGGNLVVAPKPIAKIVSSGNSENDSEHWEGIIGNGSTHSWYEMTFSGEENGSEAEHNFPAVCAPANKNNRIYQS